MQGSQSEFSVFCRILCVLGTSSPDLRANKRRGAQAASPSQSPNSLLGESGLGIFLVRPQIGRQVGWPGQQQGRCWGIPLAFYWRIDRRTWRRLGVAVAAEAGQCTFPELWVAGCLSGLTMTKAVRLPLGLSAPYPQNT